MQLIVRHLQWTGHDFRFRMTVPVSLRPLLACREMKQPLLTCNLANAAIRAIFLHDRLQPLLTSLKRSVVAMDIVMRERINHFAATYLRDFLNVGEEDLRLRTLSPDDIPRHLALFDAKIAEIQQAITANDYSAVKGELHEWLPPLDTSHFKEGEIVEGTDDYDWLCRECLKAKLTYLQIQRERFAGNYNNPYDAASTTLLASARALNTPAAPLGAIITVPPSPVPPPAVVTTLGAARNMYLADNEAAKSWTEKTRLTINGVFRLLVEFFGEDADISGFRYAMLVEFRDTIILKLPANRDKIGRFKGKTTKQIVAMHKVTPMSMASARKYLVWVCTFFRWCAKHDLIPKNPADGLIPKLGHHAASAERDIYTPAELQTMMTALSDEYKNVPRRPERFWIPVISLHNGMRLNEICQLTLNDVCQVNNIWCFDINSNGAGKQVKTVASNRIIPIHPKLIDLGFLDYVNGKRDIRQVQLWPRLKKKRDGYGQDFSKWFGRFNDKNVTAASKKVFHSFRHNFATALKQANVQDATIAELMGHENPSITTGRYGKRLQPDALLQALQGLDYQLTIVNPSQPAPPSTPAGGDTP